MLLFLPGPLSCRQSPAVIPSFLLTLQPGHQEVKLAPPSKGFPFPTHPRLISAPSCPNCHSPLLAADSLQVKPRSPHLTPLHKTLQLLTSCTERQSPFRPAGPSHLAPITSPTCLLLPSPSFHSCHPGLSAVPNIARHCSTRGLHSTVP